MIARHMAAVLLERASRHAVVAVTGPRQSGKTTLVKAAFPEYQYVSLEDLDVREFAVTDPRRFLGRFDGGVILDEVQRVPDLLSYIQTSVDADATPGRYVLTGSSNLLLHSAVSQTLAGRVSLLTLLPFSLTELSNAGLVPEVLEDFLYTGLYPRIHDKGLPPQEWYADYVRTYIERDVRDVLNISDLSRFATFVKMCAARSGQLLNLSSLGNDCGITHNTAKSWLSILEATHVVHLLRPHHVNFNKRLVKSPKIYFVDPGLLTYLLEIDQPSDLHVHAYRGAIFETWVVNEVFKARLNYGLPPRLHFWRDYSGKEVDLLVGSHPGLVPIEMKSGTTVTGDYFKGLTYWSRLSGAPPEDGIVVYGGDQDQLRSMGKVVSWRSMNELSEIARNA